jgi:hypothetical protein
MGKMRLGLQNEKGHRLYSPQPVPFFVNCWVVYLHAADK